MFFHKVVINQVSPYQIEIVVAGGAGAALGLFFSAARTRPNKVIKKQLVQ